MNLFYELPKQKIVHELYKFFVYNNNKWEINIPVIEKFGQDKLQNKKSSLIFLLNSYEIESISLISNLMDKTFPVLDDDNIYVYAICDRLLSTLDYNISISAETAQIKPIFLLLHVPEQSMKLTNIKAIIYKIYIFLSFISDVEIVVLNKNHYNEQIDLINEMNGFKLIHEKQANQKEYYKKQIKNALINSKRNIYLKNITYNYMKLSKKNKFIKENDLYFVNKSSSININIDDDIEIDIDSDNDYDYEIEENDIDSFSMNKDLSIVDSEFFEKETKFIFLLNDNDINSDIISLKKSNFIEKLKNQIKTNNNSIINYINIKEPITYRLFLTNLNQYILQENTEYLNINTRFILFPITQVCSLYINLKNDNNNVKEKLEMKLKERIIKLKELNSQNSSELSYINILLNEINMMFPSYDIIFMSILTSIFSELKNSASKQNNEIFIKELSISSKNNLNYLKEIINNQSSLSPLMKSNIINNHLNFLNNEFFSIVQKIIPKKNQLDVIQANYINHLNGPKNDDPNLNSINNSIVLDQYNNDIKILNKIFNEFNEKTESEKQQRIVDVTDKLKSATNYSIRETENVREIKVIVKTGHLNDSIEQDF